MLRLTNISIPTRIAFACLLPLAAFTVFAGKVLIGEQSTYSKAKEVAVVSEEALTITNLIHELQKERGSSAGFLNSKGQAQSFTAALQSQRPVVDKMLAAWQQRLTEVAAMHVGSKFSRDVDAAKAKLVNLASTRGNIDRVAMKTDEALDYFSSTISLLATTIDEIGELADDARIVRGAIALGSHVRRKEWAGQERSYGVIGFTDGRFTAPTMFTFIRTRTIQDSQAATFRRNVTQAQQDRVESTIKPSLDEMNRLRLIAYASPFDNTMKGVTSQQWLDISGKYIEALKTTEDWLIGEFKTVVQGVVGEARWGFWSVLALFIVLLAVCGILTSIVVLSITRPIARLVSAMRELSQGHNEIEVPGAERGDEIGKMASAVLIFRDAAVEKQRLEGETTEQRERTEEDRKKNAAIQAQAAHEQEQVVRLLAEGLGKVSSGDLTFRLNDGFSDTYKQVKEDFNTMITQLQETISAIATATREVANTAAEISTSTTDLSQRTEEQAASLEETSASMEEISATVKKNAENAQQANQYATGTREVADRGGEVVAQAVKAMSRIEDSSRKISDIIGVIDEIARQTNLLALNAAVEAARAGEAGRGFAVVASEVRSLAQRSSQAAKDIKDLITNSSGQVQEGVDLVNRAGGSLSEIVESIKRVADIVSDITAASTEQSTGIDQVNTALTQMDEVTQQNSALVEQNAAAAKALEQQAQGMDERVSFFRTDGGAAIAVARAHPVAALKRPADPPRSAPVTAAKPRSAAAPVRAAAPSRQPVENTPARPPRAAPAKQVASAGKRGPVGQLQATLATAYQDDSEWKEF
jgi:methyl-accepting chemotaxis protein